MSARVTGLPWPLDWMISGARYLAAAAETAAAVVAVVIVVAVVVVAVVVVLSPLKIMVEQMVSYILVTMLHSICGMMVVQ